MTLAYGLIVALVASGLAYCAWVLATGPLQQRAAAAAISAGQTPAFIATAMGLTAWLMPGLTGGGRYVLALSPLVAAGFAGLGARMLAAGISQPAESVTRGRYDWLIRAGVLAAAVTAIYVIAHLFGILARNLVPTIGNDSLIYLSEARAFVESGSLSALNHGDGDPSTGLPPSHPHLPLFSLYLAHGLLFADPALQPLQPVGDDLPVRFAFQASIVFLIVALAGLAMAVGRGLRYELAIPFLAVGTFALFGAFEYMSFMSSCDAFRLVPMAGLIALVTGMARAGRISIATVAGLAAATFFFLSAHTVNLYFAAVLAPVLLAALLAGKVPLKGILIAGAFAAVPAGVVGLHYFHAFQETGRFLGNGMNYYHYVGTPLEAAFRNYGDWGGSTLNFWSAFHKIMIDQGGVPSYLTLFAALALLCIAFLGQLPDRMSVSTLCLAFLSMLLVPHLLSGSSQDFSMREALIGNYRYAYTIFILAPVILAGFAGAMCELMARYLDARAGLAALITSCLFIGTGARAELKEWRSYANDSTARKERQTLLTLCKMGSSVRDGEIWLSDRANLAYSCGRFPTFMYSPRGREYFLPRSISDEVKLLLDRNVSLVTLVEKIPDWWPATPLIPALNELTVSGKFERRTLGSWTVYTKR